MRAEREVPASERRDEPGAITGPARVREEDIEPHEGLRYIAKLFKALAILLVIMLIAEIIVGIQQEGPAALATLLIEATRIVVFAGLLWGAGDLAVIMIESNHDLRATRILTGRVAYRLQRLIDHQIGESAPHEEAGPPPDVPPQVP
ncbi:MAG: hypothetical protein GX539_16015 [Candidatus Cloacimonetes bacterium]|jgi:hypothetical protein|nr:hypothetical protein [Candidatus Cloacimonadota bacterium]